MLRAMQSAVFWQKAPISVGLRLWFFPFVFCLLGEFSQRWSFGAILKLGIRGSKLDLGYRARKIPCPFSAGLVFVEVGKVRLCK
jgi:hypothetical protein